MGGGWYVYSQLPCNGEEDVVSIRWSALHRMFLPLALAVAAMLGTSSLAYADTESGQHGNYSFADDLTNFGVTCVYSGGATRRLTQVIAKPPSLWWPNTNTNNNTQHGKTGWRVLVQLSTAGGYGPWTTLSKSAIKTAIAYEDQPAYDPSDKAPFSKIKLAFDPTPYLSNSNAHVHMVIKAFWYKPDGSLMGSVTHDQEFLKWANGAGIVSSTNACPISFHS